MEGHVNGTSYLKIKYSLRAYTEDIGYGKIYANGEKTEKPAQMNGYCRVRFLAKSWRGYKVQGISPFSCRGVRSEKRM